jgi:hypothetical protein
VITGRTNTDLDGAQPKFVDIKSYRKINTAKKGHWTPMRIDVSALHPQYLANMIEGRKIRVVGRLARIGRAAILVVAEHVELKPIMV